MDNHHIKLATSDLTLITNMKETIDYQQEMLSKREKLLFAITSNVTYLSHLHKDNKN